MAETITVKIAQVAKQVASIRTSANSTLAGFLEKRELKMSSSVRVNGAVQPGTYRLRNGDIITIIDDVSGGK